MRVLTLAAAALLAACNTTQSYSELRGSGRLDLRDRTWGHFEKYRAELDPGAFVINPTTGYSFFNYCPSRQCEGGDWMREAIKACGDRSGSQCKLFANSGQIVWDGPIYVDGRLIKGDGRGQEDQAESAPPRALDGRRVSAAYRLIDGDEVSKWVQGTLVVTPKRGRQPMRGNFKDGTVCDGYVDTPKVGKGAFVESGSVDLQCLRRGAKPFELRVQGAFEAMAKYMGRFEGGDGSGRQIEAVYAPSNSK